MSDPRDSTSARYVLPQTGDAWAQDAAAQGKRGTQRLLAVENSPPDENVRQALELEPGQDVVVRRRLILADDAPVELADSHYPASIAAGTDLAANKRIKGGAVRVLTEAGYPLEDITESIVARPPTADEAETLQIDPSEWILVLSRISRPVGGKPVEYAVNRMVASRTAPLQYRMRNTAS